MKLLEIINADQLQELRVQVQEFTNYTLSNYLQKVRFNLERNPSHYNKKDIHDAVWGTIELNPGEVIIIDSPLIQRLRRISHLGLAGLLFPGAEYSRFEHTLGVLNVASRISEKIKNNQERKLNLKDITFNPTQIVRLAAIFHDAGHMIFSHASERFFSENPSFSGYRKVKRILDFFGTKTNSNIKLSELISVFIVTSPAAIELFKISWPNLEITNHYRSQAELNDFSGLIASLIIGIPVNKDMVPFHRIISGPIDADKCDYLARDSSHTGVPVAVDLYRVIQKLRLIEGLPDNMGEAWDDKLFQGDKTYLLGFSFSAVKSVEEVIVSRTLMHEKIYYHHKILTAEEMLRQALRFLDTSNFEHVKNFNFILRLVDSDIISNLPQNYFKAIAEANGLNSDFGEVEFNKACNIIKMIVERDLLKRACALNDKYMHLTPASSDLGVIDIITLLTDLFASADLQMQTTFINKICEELNSILSVLDKKDLIDENMAYLIIPIFCPQARNYAFDIPIECGGKYKRSAEFFPAETWDNSRQVVTNFNYIVSIPYLINETYIATEKVMFKEYGIILDKECHEVAKIPEAKISILKDELIDVNYYRDAFQLIPDTVFNATQLSEIDLLLENFRPYNGPQGYKITSRSQITSYIKQFATLRYDIPELFSGIIELLKSIKIIDREIIIISLAKTFEKISNHFSCSPWEIEYAVVGDYGDSSTHISYFIQNDLKESFGKKIEINNIKNILLRIKDVKKPIVFVDDAFYSGTQIISIFEEMCGIPIENRIIKETHNANFKKSETKKLKSSKIGLCYCYHNSKNLGFVEKKISELGINLSVFSAHTFPEPIFSHDSIQPFSNSKLKGKVRDAFKEIGKQLLISSKLSSGGKNETKWDEQRCENFALGYNDAQQLIIYPWNTPTYTVTALWCKGKLKDGTDWIPLFPRQSKK